MKHFYSAILFMMFSMTLSAQVQIQMPLPAQGSTFTGNVRGYWFTAPCCFTITGADIPTDAGTGNQSIAIVRFNSVPPYFSGTTNDFTTLFLVQDGSSTGIFPMNIQVETGDIIGVLGSRGGINSYVAAPVSSSINGNAVTLARLGMQLPLATNIPQNLWTESGSSISRVYLYYDTVITYNANAVVVDSLTMQLSDASDSSFYSVWDYGDGSPLDPAWNPQHTYPSGGNYTACSYITNACKTDTVCTTFTVCGGKTIAGFTELQIGYQMNFFNTSVNASSSVWDFGDGSPAALIPSPTHTYATNGTYTVTLITTNPCGLNDTATHTITTCPEPLAAGFTYNNNGASVDFTDTTATSLSWAWDFGDGSPADMTQDPSHGYSLNGVYTVRLIAGNLCGNLDTAYQNINACPELLSAGFTYSDNGTAIDFTNASSTAVGYIWNFGDGSATTTAQNPSHSYSLNGTYTVSLIANNLCGETDTAYQTFSVCPEILDAGFTFNDNGTTVDFSDTTGTATSRSWDFGDGSATVTTQNPTHTYAANGTYTVMLIATNLCGTSDTAYVDVTTCPEVLSGGFTSVVTGLTADFTGTISGASGWMWDFGDGNFSSSANPSHAYSAAGDYYVCLSSWNICGDSSAFCDSVSIMNSGIQQINASVAFTLYPNPFSETAVLTVTSPQQGGSFEFELYDVLGTMVMKSNGIMNRELLISKGSLSSGTYFFVIRNNEGILMTDKLVIY